MGYLQISPSTLADFSKAVISFWFRIPTATFTAIAAAPDPSADPNFASDTMCGAGYNPPLGKTIPLIVFGSVETDIYANPVQPSFIGVDCNGVNVKALACNLQTPINGSGSYPTGNIGGQRPGCFYMGGWTFGTGPGTTDAYVAPDVWHHALISFDIGGAQTADYDTAGGTHDPVLTSACIFTWSLDDESKVGPSMSPGGSQWALYGITDPTQIITNWMVDGIGFNGYPGPLPPYQPGDTASFSGGYIASSGNPIGIPTTTAFVSNGLKVEMAELQIFTGVSIDASAEASRRAFITVAGAPADMSLAVALLGQAPDIKLHTSISWISGTNTGSLGTNFAATGTITAYTPDPS